MNSLSNKTYFAIAFLLVVAICILPLVTITDSEFGGADGQAMDLIAEIDGSYVPWMESFWEPPGGETESLLFALQAALGSGVFFFIIGYFMGNRKKNDGGKGVQG